MAERFYYDYLSLTKSNDIGKTKHSRIFRSFHMAKADAMRKYKSHKIIQARFWNATSRYNQKIVGTLDTKGRVRLGAV